MSDDKESPLERVVAYLDAVYAEEKYHGDVIDSFAEHDLTRTDLRDVTNKLRQAYGEMAVGQGSRLMDEAWHQGFEAAEDWCAPGDAEMGRPKPESPYRPKE